MKKFLSNSSLKLSLTGKFSFFLALAITLSLAFLSLKFGKYQDFSYKGKDPKKVFIVTGEPSADRLGGWFLNKIKQQNPQITCEAIGSHHLKDAGATLYKNTSELAIGAVGIGKFLQHIPTLKNSYKQTLKYILKNKFEWVVLVDCPFINIPLARKLKQKKRHKIKITYIAPPELWLWGSWGIDNALKAYCDQIIVLFPHELEWFRKQGINVDYYGLPFYKDFEKQFKFAEKKENQIAMFIGSRKSEIDLLLPIFAQVIKKFQENYLNLKIILPIPKSFTEETINQIKNRLQKNNINLNKITIIHNDEEKFKQIAKCCMAIAKPGTATLELALLKVPTIVIYKLPWLSYQFAKLVFKQEYVSLPNLILNKPVFKELIQHQCIPENIFMNAEKLYLSYLENDDSYQKVMEELTTIRTTLKPKKQ